MNNEIQYQIPHQDGKRFQTKPTEVSESTIASAVKGALETC